MKYLIFLIASFTVHFWANPGQSAQTEVSSLKEFDQISLAISGDLNISKGEFRVTKEGDQKRLDNIEMVVKDRTLIIRNKSRKNFSSGKVVINVTMPSLDGIEVAGSGKVSVKDQFRGSKLRLEISGSGKIKMDAPDYQKLHCAIAGSGKCLIFNRSKMNNGKIDISGSGTFTAEKCEFNEMDINISGSGDCTVSVKETLKVNIAGSGKVFYSGNPEITKRISGSGKVIRNN